MSADRCPSIPSLLSERDMPDFNDEPIKIPEDDAFGFDPLAKAISDCIRGMEKPVGSVVAINGPWGSGKSSLVNLVRHHLDHEDPDLTVVEFQSWLYRTEADLVAAFFRELYSVLKPALTKNREAFLQLGAIVTGAGSAAVMTGEPTAVVTGKALGLATSNLQKYIERGGEIERLQQSVRNALDKQPRRFLVVVDDLDRLSPDEALAVFRLIKSVGRLPKVAYLLAFDRIMTERAVSCRYPSEGPHYLEKIVQAGFELPEISRSHIDGILQARLKEILPVVEEAGSVFSSDLYHQAVAQEIRTARDVKRLTGMLSVTWNAVRGEVNIADFLALETLRLFRPHLYGAIRSNKDRLVDTREEADSLQPERQTEDLRPFLDHEPKDQRDRLRGVLFHLFPGAASGSQGSGDEGSRDRRVCAPEHFDTYFRFCLSPEAVPRREIEELVRLANDDGHVNGHVKQVLIASLGIGWTKGRTKASYLLEALRAHSEDFHVSSIRPFLVTLFAIADEFLDKPDKVGSYIPVDNGNRIYRLVTALVRDRIFLKERSDILGQACRSASLGWLVYFNDLVHKEHHPGKDRVPALPKHRLTTEDDAAAIRQETLSRIRRAAKDDDLLGVSDLAHVLLEWCNMSGKESGEVRDWTTEIMKDDQGVVRLAEAFNPADIKKIEGMLDPRRFLERIDDLRYGDCLSDEQRRIVERHIPDSRPGA